MEKILAKIGIEALNKMQIATQKSILEHPNTLLLSPTGSGKTLAFLLPLLQILKPVENQIQAIILVPTRELALQIESVWKSIGSGHKISAFYGGHSMEVEVNSLKNPPALVVGTPGRIADHYTRHTIDSKQVETIIFDEFDKSLEMGFHEQMQFILERLPKLKKYIFVSATQGISLPGFLKIDAVNTLDFINDGQRNEGLTLKYVRTNNKIRSLNLLLGQITQTPTLIFCNQRDEVEEVANLLMKNGINCGVFHGKIEQVDREKALIRFRNGSVRYLISTDLAARGLDIPEVENVIHYSMPFHEQEFIHRNGRTARMNATGVAYFFLEENAKQPPYISQLPEELVLEQKQQAVTKESWTTLYFSGGKKDKINKIDIVGFCLQKGGIEKEALGKIEVQDFASYVAIATAQVHSFLKNIKDQKIKGKKLKIEVAR
ncbi:DEAD/DEAH box helicase [Lacihabitans sp. CS3-21]|uniref:DEAD/DEAH box helicase n=1 Tax=Lacihabitans sp. CS3-21 TaxID=2487332 RepID=UPI0020CF4FAE|nr:DEAD/DEAH box helicase [Lacihabitans sp. CS3-21]MCP9747307.1 DEAD/DEAH box helicase [Lacihabitans sp. CS3-21]